MIIKYALASLIVFSIFSSFSYAETGYEKDEFNLEQTSLDFYSEQSCNCVAFRLDDVQDYWLTESQVSIIDVFQNKRIPLTIGIIGSGFGDDPKITDFVKRATDADGSLMEIANHGWEHESFPTFDRKTQSDLIKKTDERLKNLLGVKPIVFIPPQNAFNNDTMIVLKENSYSHFSSNVDLSTPPFPFQGLPVYNFPSNATTGLWNEDLWQFQKVTHDEAFGDIKKSLDSYGFAVVTMHPQEFSTLGTDGTWVNEVDMNQIQELGHLIDKIQDSGLKIVFISKINENVLENKITIPKWFENVYSWWSDGKISNGEISNGIKYLQEHGVMKLIIEKEYDALTNFSLSKAIAEQKNPIQKECSGDWTITGYYIPDESDFSGELKPVLVGNSEISYKTDFLEEVKIEGWGKTSQGYYLGSYDNAFHVYKHPLDTGGEQLTIPTVAVDPNLIGLGSKLTVPSLPYPWGDVVFEATDVGTAIIDKHIDIFVGEGYYAQQETFQQNSSEGIVCISPPSD